TPCPVRFRGRACWWCCRSTSCFRPYPSPGVAHQQLAAVEAVQRAATGEMEAAGGREAALLHADAKLRQHAVARGVGTPVEAVGDGVAGVAVHLAHGAERTVGRPGEAVAALEGAIQRQADARAFGDAAVDLHADLAALDHVDVVDDRTSVLHL